MKVIQLENVSKMYRLGEVGTGTLSHDLSRAWAKFCGKEDPFAKVGQVNNREEAGGEYVWALKDINLEVEEGEILGIIGRNGAGKSTLLKLLSRVTAPTTGNIRARGRIASLLEVGTGFHPELTGRENIYLNGALLGMTRREITRRLDEIVEFSGCAKYLDTPVKRYSSGMTVRLGFAVAAHLECEILIVDEVLAVGDAEFQKKCIGKMEDVARGGRTVLFVSHNMGVIERVCPQAILLKDGNFIVKDKCKKVIEKYETSTSPRKKFDSAAAKPICITSAEVHTPLNINDNHIIVTADIWSSMPDRVALNIRLNDHLGSPVAFGSLGTFNKDEMIDIRRGTNRITIQHDLSHLAQGAYRIDLEVTHPFIRYIDKVVGALILEWAPANTPDSPKRLDQKWGEGSWRLHVKKINIEYTEHTGASDAGITPSV